ncbi:MAG: hypothetical protein IPJ77_11665 [Planctomycetes bacterium]|nr:hypothetical protein [Planctomycetota bacterium]
MSRARRGWVAGAGALATLAVALATWSTLPERTSSGAPRAPSAATGASASLDSPSPDARHTVAAPGTAPDAPLLDGAELADLLARIQRAYEAGDASELEALLTALVARPEQLDVVADWLASAHAARAPEACLGAFVVLEAAIGLYERDPARFGRAGVALVERLLDELLVLPEDMQARLVRLFQRVRGPNGPVLDLRFLRRILDLRAAHPADAERFVPLLAHVAQGFGAAERREEFQRLFLEGQDDPLLVKCALSSLLSGAPEVFLPLAEDFYARSAEDARLRSAIAQSIAASAPVEDATRSLVHLADEAQYGAFATLGSRPSAGEAIAREYDALLAENANPVARKLLVSTMRDERAEVLVGIAGMDPDPMVGLQATLTLSVRGEMDSARFAEVRELFSSGGRLPHGGALVAENVLLHSSGAVRDSARAWLVEIVRDGRATDVVRLDAYQRVRRWVEPGTFRGVQIGGRVVE